MAKKSSTSQRSDDDNIVPLIDPGSLNDDVIIAKARELLDHDSFRKRTIEIVEEYTNSVPFMEKVQKYASEQFDKRMLNSVKIWGLTIATIVGTALATVYLPKLIH